MLHVNIFQERIEKSLAENNFRVIPKEKQKLIFNDQVLKPDNSPVYWIAGVGVGCKIHLGTRLTFSYILIIFG